MKKTWYLVGVIVIIIILAFILVNRGTEEAAEESVERAIEKATNGAADVDLDDGTLAINTNEGTFSATTGEDVELPSNFPSDIYVPDGTITTVTENIGIDSFTIAMESDDSVSQLKEEFEAQLEGDGWTISATFNVEGSTTLSAAKDDRVVSVNISEGDDATLIIIGTYNTTET